MKVFVAKIETWNSIVVTKVIVAENEENAEKLLYNDRLFKEDDNSLIGIVELDQTMEQII